MMKIGEKTFFEAEDENKTCLIALDKVSEFHRFFGEYYATYVICTGVRIRVMDEELITLLAKYLET